MFRSLICVIAFALTPAVAAAEPEQDSERELIIQKMNDDAKNDEAKLSFELNPMNPRQIWIFRGTSLAPDEVKDWEAYFWSVGTSAEELGEKGFSSVRIYTNQSRNLNKDYALWAAAGFTDTKFRCHDGTGGGLWDAGYSAASSSLRR